MSARLKHNVGCGSAPGLLLALTLPVSAGTVIDCRFDSPCLYDEGCAIFDAPIPMAIQLGAEADAGTGRFDNFRDSFDATLRLTDRLGDTRSDAISDGAQVLGLLTIHGTGRAMMSRHSVGDPEYGALYSGFCRRS